MPEKLTDPLRAEFAALDPANSQYATQLVERLLAAGRAAEASDLHLQPTAAGLDVRWRIDGVLEHVATLPPRAAPNVIARLKVLAELLTYRNDTPQEGRIRGGESGVEIRVSTLPTLYGEKAVVRLFADRNRYAALDSLGFDSDMLAALGRLLAETSGAVLVTGPAGSGKTTTLYACLREIAAQSAGGRSLASLEDPIESAVSGVAQSQVNPAIGFDLSAGLRFLLRQDPEVIMVGEIRDAATAEVAFQASLTGHLVLSSFHAGGAAGAISRLSDMGIAPYLLRSGILAIVSQRLVRKLCRCARPAAAPEALLGLPVERAWLPAGCAECRGSGYQGRAVVAEMLLAEASELGRAILSRSDKTQLEQLAVRGGMIPLRERACQAVAAGITSPAEVRRVLGLGDVRDE
ncbi:MAG TPA: GspE/PulE family protein [Pirellulales bacterium]|nr:GspE/PulE family protein [Pirellulales bacterium]